MRSARLGRTDMQVTTVGLGTFALGGADWSYGWGSQDDTDSVATIRRALEAGINWIETAAVYGLGRSEEIVSRALRGVPEADRPLLFTKCGMRWDPAAPFARPTRVGSARSLRAEVDDSLRRLGVERIDLYQMHWPAADGTDIEDYWGTLVSLREAGKVRAVGLCNHDVAQVKRAQSVGLVDCLQMPLSAIRRDTAATAQWCADNGISFLAWGPMQAGLLAGQFDRRRVGQLDPGDWRRASPSFTSELDANLTVAAAIAQVAARYEVAPAAVAVAWVLRWPGVSAAIVGARRPVQLAGWLPAANLNLCDADLNEIAEAVDSARAGVGPARPSADGGTPRAYQAGARGPVAEPAQFESGKKVDS